MNNTKRKNTENSESPQKKQKQQTSSKNEQPPLSLQLNPSFADPAFVKQQHGLFSDAQPFRHIALRDFLSSVDDQTTTDNELNRVIKAIQSEETFFRKKNDLYDFFQSDDLKLTQASVLQQLRDLIYAPATVQLVQDISGVSGLSCDKIDLTSSVYLDGGYLLCHDDRLESRKIAFILYLVDDDWNAQDGGHLDLFTIDPTLQGPLDVAKSILPQRNTFLFFKVSERSFHQVREILSANKQRITVGGWFHSRDPSSSSSSSSSSTKDTPSSSSSSSTLSSSQLTEKTLLKEWINPAYLSPQNQKVIAQQFQEIGALELALFLNKEKFNQLQASFSSSSDDWQLVGPANKQRYYTRPMLDTDPTVRSFLSLIESNAFQTFIVSVLCAMDEKVMECSRAVRKFETGCYTLLHDENQKFFNQTMLELLFFIEAPPLEAQSEGSEKGGYTAFVEGEETLITIPPASNTMSLVLSEPGQMHFVKYVTHHQTHPTVDFTLSWSVVQKQKLTN